MTKGFARARRHTPQRRHNAMWAEVGQLVQQRADEGWETEAFYVPSHLSAGELLASTYDIEDWLGNACADKLAGDQAAQAAPDGGEEALNNMVEERAALVRRRLVAMGELMHSHRQPADQEQCRVKPRHAAAADRKPEVTSTKPTNRETMIKKMAGHTLTLEGRLWACTKCHHSYRG